MEVARTELALDDIADQLRQLIDRPTTRDRHDRENAPPEMLIVSGLPNGGRARLQLLTDGLSSFG
jgi:hypothetical protein